MTAPKLTRARRRRMRSLADQVERMAQADLRYFLRFPRRRHRIRVAGAAEIDLAELLGGAMSLPPGKQRYTAVRYLTADACLRLMIIGPPDCDPESYDEPTAQAIFKQCAPKYPCRVYVQGGLTHEQMFAMVEVLK